MSKTTTQPAGAQPDFVGIDELMDSAPLYISGTTSDLIRDGHGHPASWLHNSQALPDDSRAIFLLGRGWSATAERRQRLFDAGIPTMAVNDFPAEGPPPWYWCTGDPPSYFGNRIWDDPEVMKFSPVGSCRGLRPRLDAYDHSKTPVDAPNSHFFHARYDDPTYHNWLHVPWVNWGTSLFGEDTPQQWFKHGAARSSMFIGLRLCWHLGFRVVYLLGCDCTPHHHPAPMYWPTILYLIDQLAPVFRHYHYHVYQCNPDSHLRSFEITDFESGLERAAGQNRKLPGPSAPPPSTPVPPAPAGTTAPTTTTQPVFLDPVDASGVPYMGD